MGTKLRRGKAMTRKIGNKPGKNSAPEGETLKMPAQPGKTQEARIAGFGARGILPVAAVLTAYSKDVFSDAVSLTETYSEVARLSEASTTGDLAHLERLLSAQVLALNSVFAGLAHRAKTNSSGGYLGAADTYMRLALRAQAQCRQTAQTLFEMKNPHPVAFVRQANIANGPQQVNFGPSPGNVTSTRKGARAEENESAPNELLEASDGERMDFGAQSEAGGANQDVEPVGAVNRPAHR